MALTIETTELPLAVKLYQHDANKLADMKLVRIRSRSLMQFTFKDVDAGVVEEFRSGRDGISQYETCRKMLLRIIELETRKCEMANQQERPSNIKCGGVNHVG